MVSPFAARTAPALVGGQWGAPEDLLGPVSPGFQAVPEKSPAFGDVQVPHQRQWHLGL